MRKRIIAASTIDVLLTRAAARVVDLWLARAQEIRTAEARATAGAIATARLGSVEMETP